MEIVLGTAQFGLNYGVSNKTGKVCIRDVEKILTYCCENSITELDTAIAYGDVYEVLGKFDLSPFQITSKIPKLDLKKNLQDQVTEYIDRTFEKLNISCLHNLLLHEEEDFYESDEIFDYLKSIKKKYNIVNVGVSIYNIKDKLEKNYDSIDVIQVPGSIVDRRYESITFDEIYLRSIFLQGLLLMEKRPDYFKHWEAIFSKLDVYLNAYPTRLEGIVNHINRVNPDQKVVVGVTSVSELDKINAIRNFSDDALIPAVQVDDPNLINPGRWQL
jgi:hypothetical protein